MKTRRILKSSLWKKTLMSVCVAFLLIIICMPQTVQAAVELYPQTHGVLDENEQETFSFYVQVESTVDIVFEGLNDDDEGTYGWCILKIMDALGNVVFETNSHITFDDTTISTILPMGNYVLSLQENDDFEFEYLFSIKATATVEVPAQTLKLNKKKLSLSEGKTYNLKAKVTPSYATDVATWKSSNKKVATVDASGKVTAKGLGNAVITVKVGSKKAKCNVTVKSTYLEIDKSKSKNLKKTIKNIKGYKKASWKSSNTSIASVGGGKVSGHAHGKTKLTAKVSGKTYTIRVYVYDHEVLVSKAKSKLKSILKHPSSLVINKISGSGNFVNIDYSAMNGFGGYNRGDFMAWFDKGSLQYLAY